MAPSSMAVVVAVAAASRAALAGPLEMRPRHQRKHSHHVGWIAVLGEFAIGSVDVDEHPLGLVPVTERLPGNVTGRLLVGHAGIEALARLHQDELEVVLEI